MASRAIVTCEGPIPRGRPSSYTQEIADEICQRLMEGETLTAICRDESMPARSTVCEWLMRDREGFSGQYALAREFQADFEAEEIIDISDDAYGDAYIDYDKDGKPFVKIDSDNVNRARLKVETRKWRAERLNRRVYGNNVQHKHEIELRPALPGKELPPALAWLDSVSAEPEG